MYSACLLHRNRLHHDFATAPKLQKLVTYMCAKSKLVFVRTFSLKPKITYIEWIVYSHKFTAKYFLKLKMATEPNKTEKAVALRH